MNNDPTTSSDPAPDARRVRRYTRGAIAFGVVMATIEMGVLLYFAYC
jgi:hypothetical protein